MKIFGVSPRNFLRHDVYLRFPLKSTYVFQRWGGGCKYVRSMLPYTLFFGRNSIKAQLTYSIICAIVHESAWRIRHGMIAFSAMCFRAFNRPFARGLRKCACFAKKPASFNTARYSAVLIDSTHMCGGGGQFNA